MDMENNNIELKGKVAKFPKNTKAVNALNFLENIKINKNKIWYVLIENQDNQLKCVKYNRVNGVDLNQLVGNLKEMYLVKFMQDAEVVKSITEIVVTGESDFSVINNIPDIKVDGVTLLSKITSDLIKLLAI